MKTREPTLGLPIKGEMKNDAIWAAARAKLYMLTMQPGETPAQVIIARAKTDKLLQLLIAAPDDMIASC